MSLIGRSFEDPDDMVELPLLQDRVVQVGGFVITRESVEPGWRWSEHARPVVGGEWCQEAHVGVTVAGSWGVALSDGTSIEYGPGDIFQVPPGHDSWTIGDEPCVTIEWAAR